MYDIVIVVLCFEFICDDWKIFEIEGIIFGGGDKVS